MKKIVIVLTLITLMFNLVGCAQKRKVTSALGYKEAGNLERAYEEIQIAIDPENPKSEKSIPWPRTWEVYGEILHEIHKEKKGFVEQPLFKAFDAYKKAIELDEDDRYSKSLVVDLTLLQAALSNYAIEAYNKEQFDITIEAFERYLDISNMPIMVEATGAAMVDTAIIYNTGMAASQAENWDKAIKYLGQSIDIGYNEEASYQLIYQAYQAKGDTTASFEIIKEGFEKFPENEALNVELINYFMSQGDADATIKYIENAIKNNPTNKSYYTAKAQTLEGLGQVDEAIEMYKKVIEMDEEQFAPNYNLGVIFFNRGVSEMNEASQLPPSENEKYNQKIEKGKEYLKEALPYIEMANDLRPNNLAIMESLRLIYYRLQMNDKYKAFDEKIKSMPAEEAK